MATKPETAREDLRKWALDAALRMTAGFATEAAQILKAARAIEAYISEQSHCEVATFRDKPGGGVEHVGSTLVPAHSFEGAT